MRLPIPAVTAMARAPHGPEPVWVGEPLPRAEEADRLNQGEAFAWRLSLAAATEALGGLDHLTLLERGVAYPARPDLAGDIVLARKDVGVAYHLAVVLDDALQGVTHVIRGDDHLNNAARQTLIYQAMDWDLPAFAHIPLIHGPDGAKLSKRHGAQAVGEFADMGYIPEGLRNYLARLGWSHGDDEIFSREQFVQWFNLDHLGKSAAQFDEAKLRWVNAQHLKVMSDAALAPLVSALLLKRGITTDDRLPRICGLFKDRCDTTVALADWAATFYADVTPQADDLAQHVTDAVRPAIAQLAELLSQCAWDKAAIAAVLKQVLAAHGLKMPQLAMPVRVLVLCAPAQRSGWRRATRRCARPKAGRLSASQPIRCEPVSELARGR